MSSNQEPYPLLRYILSHQNGPESESEPDPDLLIAMPYLTHPELVQSMADSVSDIIQTHSFATSLGARPAAYTIDAAAAKIAAIESGIEGKEGEEEAYRAIVRLDQMHMEYDKKLVCGEKRLREVYEIAVDRLGLDGDGDQQEVYRQVAEILEKAAKGEIVERIEIVGKQLKIVPQGFGRVSGLLVLHLSNNLLQVLPDSISKLQKLEVLNVSSNLLESLPESIGMLTSLKILNVSGNKLKTLTESIAGCSNLEELNASYNNLTRLPVNMGYGLTNLNKLYLSLNKIKFLPPSLCEIESLQILDAHFNELHSLPDQIGRLVNLEILNVSSNFSNLTSIPNSICELIKLRELDLSNNQIRYLPDDFFRLESLERFRVDENPLVIPPLEEAAGKGATAVRAYMSKRWQDILVEDQKRRMMEASKQSRGRWLGWSPSMFSDAVYGMSESFSAYISEGIGPKGCNES